MGSISNEIFCKTLRASKDVYATDAVYTSKLVLQDSNHIFNLNARYFNSVLNSQGNLTVGTEYDLGAAITAASGETIAGIPAEYGFLYQFPGAAPLAAGASVELHLKDARAFGGFFDAGFSPQPAQNIWITEGSVALWYEIRITCEVSSATQTKITFKNTGAADYIGAIRFCMTQKPAAYTN